MHDRKGVIVVAGSDDLIRQAKRTSSGGGPGKAPRRGTAVVACIDARVEPNSILGGTQGDYHVIRNAGGVVTSDVLRSLIVSQYYGTTKVVVMMHTDCGAMAYPAESERRRLEAETGEQARFVYGFDDLETELARGVERLRGTQLLAHRDAIRGVIYDIDSGTVRTVIG